jgi:hypothetical protein
MLLLLGTLVGSRMAHAQTSTDYFHQRLSPYGQWGTHAGYGEVWRPRVAASWRPYSTGHWVYSDYGWTWAADESWGWGPFHYGRWYHDASLGWGWVPGNVWAPAWVDWRSGGGYLGWAALPPEAGFSVGVGVSFGGFDINAANVSSYYCFVPEAAILQPRLGGFIVSPARNVGIIRGTANMSGLAMVNNRVFNQGMSVQRAEQVTGHAVPRVQVGQQAAFYRPAVVTKAALQTKSESFVNRPATQIASATPRPTPAGSRTTGSPVAKTQPAKRSSATVAASRSAAAANQGHTPKAVARTPAPPAKHASPPPTAARSAAAEHPPVAAAKSSQRRTQQASPKAAPPARHAVSANAPKVQAQRSTTAKSKPPVRGVTPPSAHPAAPAAKRPERPPPPSKEQPQDHKEPPAY